MRSPTILIQRLIPNTLVGIKRTYRTLKAVRPSAALRDEYQRRLVVQVEAMHRSLTYWIAAAYRDADRRFASDASPSRDLASVMRKRGRYWNTKFKALAPDMASYFSTKASERVDSVLHKMLADAGVTVEFKMTAAQNNVVQAATVENVGLITNLASQHVASVEGLVMRSIAAGRDMESLANGLRDQLGVTKRRAALIARHQNNQATANLTKSRQVDLGLKARWRHSAGGKVPRPDHVVFSGKIYDPVKGAFLEGKWVWPGSEINCRCVSEIVLPI